eukprot:30959-Pelagococcus_subviridis.AAC.4
MSGIGVHLANGVVWEPVYRTHLNVRQREDGDVPAHHLRHRGDRIVLPEREVRCGDGDLVHDPSLDDVAEVEETDDGPRARVVRAAAVVVGDENVVVVRVVVRDAHPERVAATQRLLLEVLQRALHERALALVVHRAQ